MQLHQISRLHKNKSARQVGRGGKRGKTSGRGTKGQNARSGRKKRPEMRDIIKKIPKLRGRGVFGLKSIQVKPTAIHLSVLATHFDNGAEITLSSIMEKGLVKQYKGRNQPIKILSGKKTEKGEEKISKKLIIKGIPVSKGAKEILEKAGGSVSL